MVLWQVNFMLIVSTILFGSGLCLVPVGNVNGFNFAADYCLSNASPSFMAGYARAHYHIFFNSSYNERDGIPQNDTYYNSQTGIKLEGQNARADYVHGYWLGWNDAVAGKYHIAC